MIGTHCDCKPKNTELVQEVKENMPAFDEIMNLSDFFKVMGDSTRLQLFIIPSTKRNVRIGFSQRTRYDEICRITSIKGTTPF